VLPKPSGEHRHATEQREDKRPQGSALAPGISIDVIPQKVVKQVHVGEERPAKQRLKVGGICPEVRGHRHEHANTKAKDNRVLKEPAPRHHEGQQRRQDIEVDN